ncbi:MAG: AtpZ/AtpI family protein [Desulfobacteraceae bacterium]|nr:MAG: AtpZ/AtpI family protein [Desulfobacteraceae bacterium]
MEKDTKKLFKSLTNLSSIGLVMAVCIALGGLLGHYLDRKWGTAPIFLIICFLLGAAAAFKNLYTQYKKMQANEK